MGAAKLGWHLVLLSRACSQLPGKTSGSECHMKRLQAGDQEKDNG